ncbi:MAG: hypothetical protein ACUZ8A_06500 [Candidatus Bathyanammoxibius sp.]
MTFRPDRNRGRIARVPPTEPLSVEPVAQVPPAEPIEELAIPELQVEEPVGEPLSIEPVTPLPTAEPIGEFDTGAESTAVTPESESPPIQGTDLDYLFEVPQSDDPDMEIRDLVGLDIERDIVGGSLDEATSVSEEDILGDSFDVSDPDELARPPTRPASFRPQRTPRKRPLPPAGGFIGMR